jgi:Metal-dependent hydrolase
MKYFRIGTLNCQNNSDNRSNTNNNASILAGHIIEKEYDILGTQELTNGFMKKVDASLKEYDFYGGYQYGRGVLGTKLPVLRDYNQSNQIITQRKVVSASTRALPWIPNNFEDIKKGLKKKAISRRIVTRIELEDNYNRFYIINTHLDYYLPRLQQRQLNYLIKKVRKYAKYGYVVLMGDFNLQITNPMFRNFENELNAIGLRRVPVNEKTNSDRFASKTAVDHIFIPKNWKIAACGTFNTIDLGGITDHKAVYVDVII